MYLPRLPLQAYAEASAALGGRELTTEERWGAAVGLVAALGDAASALRLAGEPNNQYRLVRVVDILLQSGGVPLAGERASERGTSARRHAAVCAIRFRYSPGGRWPL